MMTDLDGLDDSDPEMESDVPKHTVTIGMRIEHNSVKTSIVHGFIMHVHDNV
jgi:hypothetical protein